MRHGGRPEKEKRLILVTARKGERLFGNEISRVVAALEASITLRLRGIFTLTELVIGKKRRVLQVDRAIIIPQIGRVVVVRHALAVVAKPAIKTLLQRLSRRARPSEPPLAKASVRVAHRLEHLRKGDRALWNGKLAFVLRLSNFRQADGIVCLAIVANKRMTRMQPRHQHAARRRADGIACIHLRKTHPLRRHAVDIRRANDFLAVAAEIAWAKIIGENENHIRQASVRSECTREGEETSQELHGSLETTAGCFSFENHHSPPMRKGSFSNTPSLMMPPSINA